VLVRRSFSQRRISLNIGLMRFGGDHLRRLHWFSLDIRLKRFWVCHSRRLLTLDSG
jgi:hypothetical protein